MITKYVIEVYNSSLRKYVPMYETNNFGWAEKTFDKPYYRAHTRRLIVIRTELLYTIKAGKSSEPSKSRG